MKSFANSILSKKSYTNCQFPMNDMKFSINNQTETEVINHPNLENFLMKCKNNNIRSLYIIDKLINNFAFIIEEDILKNDIRNLHLNSYIFGKIKIVTSFIFDEKSDKKEYIEIDYNFSDKNIYRNICSSFDKSKNNRASSAIYVYTANY